MEKFTVVLIMDWENFHWDQHYYVEAKNAREAEKKAYNLAYKDIPEAKDSSNMTLAIYRGHHLNIIGETQ